jgi:predicted amidohydrolase YtcJ
MSAILALCAFLGFSSTTLAEESSPPPVDLLLHGGRVITLVDPEPTPAATALAISGDCILQVGDDATILALRQPTTRVINLAGAVVVPGFHDAHAHLYGLGKALAQVDLVGTLSAREAALRVAAKADAAPAAAWLTGRGWDQNDWEVAEFPHRRLLDEVVGDRPVYLRRVDGHAAWVSSAALRLARVTRTTADPEGGRIIRDTEGEPTGVLIDNAIDLVSAVIPLEDEETMRELIANAMTHCLRHGITAVQEAGVSGARVELYKQMHAQGELQLRLYAMLDDDEATLADGFAAGPYTTSDGMLTVRAVKLYADGALGSRGARLLADYSDEPGNQGLLVTSREHLLEVALRAGRAGFQVCTHAIGDGANRLVLDLYQELLASLQLDDARWRIEHAQILAPTDIPRFAELGVIASMQPVHCTSDMDWADERLGPDRLAGAYAWRSLLESGAHLCFGTDFPVEHVDPMAGLYAARTRTHADGTPTGGWFPDQCLAGRQALQLYTVGSAYAAFQERELGRLQPGMLADLTVLSGDPVHGPAEELQSLEVLMTVVGGKIRYTRGS